MASTYLFLHGLDSSSKGTKARFFSERFPDMIIPDFEGSLELRLKKLEQICSDNDNLHLIGSSFGGLMAACFATRHPTRVKKLFLLAPALNFPGYLTPVQKIEIPTFLLIGEKDTVTPPADVLPVAKQSFANLEIHIVDEDHLLHHAFSQLDWKVMLTP